MIVRRGAKEKGSNSANSPLPLQALQLPIHCQDTFYFSDMKYVYNSSLIFLKHKRVDSVYASF